MISEETRKKMRQAKLKNPTRFWLNKKRPELARDFRERMAGKPFSGESYNWTGKKQTKEHIEKRVSKLRGKERSEATKKKISEWNINNPRHKNKDTVIELKVEQVLEGKKILFKKHYSLLGIACVDFYLPKFNSVIQCDGCYWHNCLFHCPKGKIGSRDKDERQDFLLEQEGVKVFRLWEHEILHPERSYSSKITLDMILDYLINK
jgi:G:T-mismatch repair DNA endonuclease (very short patch repair protein)